MTEPQENIEAVTEMDTRYINKRGGVWHTDLCFPAKIGVLDTNFRLILV